MRSVTGGVSLRQERRTRIGGNARLEKLLDPLGACVGRDRDVAPHGSEADHDPPLWIVGAVEPAPSSELPPKEKVEAESLLSAGCTG